VKTDQNKVYPLADYNVPSGDYMMLESLYHDKNTSRIIYVLEPKAQAHTFKLGRGHDADLRYNDISLSRVHALIKFKNGSWYLEDNDSKFGTLVLVKQRTPLLPDTKKSVQVGRTLINFKVQSKQEAKSSDSSSFNAMFP
jgi:pSer/pThr/pTyr-binding forkhead associated (FHA) protein